MARTLLESICKHILDENGIGPAGVFIERHDLHAAIAQCLAVIGMLLRRQCVIDGRFRYERQSGELTDLALVDGRLEGEVEILEGALEREVREPCPGNQVPLPPGWALLVYTDGLIEGRVGDGRLGVGGLCRLVAEHRRAGAPIGELPEWLVAQAEQRNGDPLPDDVAMLLLTGEPA